jgi:hypothetical protein
MTAASFAGARESGQPQTLRVSTMKRSSKKNENPFIIAIISRLSTDP